MAETLIELRNLVKKFPVDGGGNLLVINGMSFTVEKGSGVVVWAFAATAVLLLLAFSVPISRFARKYIGR